MHNSDMGIETDRIQDTDSDGESWDGASAGWALVVVGGAVLVAIVIILWAVAR